MVYYYHKLVNKEENVKTICEECKKGERGCVQCKKELITAMNEFLKPIQEKRKFYEDHPEEVDKILEKGTKDADKLSTLRGTDTYMSPILYNGLKMEKEDVVHDLYKSDVFSLGYSMLYAVSLNHGIIKEIRKYENMEGFHASR